jgi:hypothetical protein
MVEVSRLIAAACPASHYEVANITVRVWTDTSAATALLAKAYAGLAAPGSGDFFRHCDPDHKPPV